MSREYEDSELDAMLRDHLAAELDGQLGRAERTFRDHARLPSSEAVTTLRPRMLRSHAWMIGALGAAVAASMAAMWVVPIAPPGGDTVAMTRPMGPDDVRASQSGGTPTEATPDSQPQWQQVEKIVDSMTLDDGLVLLDDNTPARLVRQVAMEQVEWVDSRLGVRVQAVVPREAARLIPIDTY